MSERGFSLIELLLACLLFVAVGGAVAGMARPVRDAVERSVASGDLDNAARSALEIIASDLREAGMDAAIAPPQVRLRRVFAAVWPMTDLDSADFVRAGGAVRVTAASRLGPQALLRAAAAPGDTALLLDTATRCAGGPPACGFASGMTALVYDAFNAEPVVIAAVGSGFVTITAPLTMPAAAGAVVVERRTTIFGTRPGVDGSRRLVRLTTGGAEQPMLEQVVEFTIETDADDPHAIHSAAVTLRLEAASPSLRGPAGPLFRRAGTALHPSRFVPDVETRLTLALRAAPGAS